MRQKQSTSHFLPLTDCNNLRTDRNIAGIAEKGCTCGLIFMPLLQFIIFLSCCVNNVKLPLSFLHSPNPPPLSTSLCHRDSSLPPMSPPSSNYLHFIEYWILRFRRPEKILWAKFSCKLICLSIKILSGIDRAETVKRYIRIGELFIVMNFGQNTILRAEFLLFSVSSGLMGLNSSRHPSVRQSSGRVRESGESERRFE